MYEDEGTQSEGIAVDGRVTLMQQIVDMEQVHGGLQRNSEELAGKAAKLSEQIKAARSELAQRMGWGDGNEPVRAMGDGDAKRIIAGRLRTYEGR